MRSERKRMNGSRRIKRIKYSDPSASTAFQGSAAAVVMAHNEQDTLPLVLSELAKLQLAETVVVLNGCSDNSFSIARSFPDATIVHYAEKLGHDVGRAIGARLTKADIVLFVDGDFRIGAEQLRAFIAAVARGADVALNNITPYLPLFRDWDDVTRLKAFLNLSLGRPDLLANSMTSVPHALSRRAVNMIGSSLLAVPPKAQAAALREGLRVQTAASVNVFGPNRHRDNNVGLHNEMSRLIVGDHVEALKHVMEKDGRRLAHLDTMRQRSDGSRKPSR
ncbi:glycosyl transferase family 2 [Paenibacillus curdlanolyticus YK9]|uniref:Glycosyl transferase family 2 n=1 Tax=Paenibacillus curdlanolyticus YK9 TaxID=717606 RepID=E0IFJ1_9BACL|nr:glycosyltransferase [Paenibacillus curdlanolyticus]EFM08967.1 glycosyl transferase family 2 [Paenibacillus curdlanolyticus YK9]